MKKIIKITMTGILSILLLLIANTATYARAIGAQAVDLSLENNKTKKVIFKPEDVIADIEKIESESRSGVDYEGSGQFSFKKPALTPELLREILPFTSLAYHFGKHDEKSDTRKKTKAEISRYKNKGWMFEPFHSDKGFQSLEVVHALYNDAAKRSGQLVPLLSEDVVFAENDLSGFVALKEAGHKEYIISIAPHGSQNLTDWLMNGLFLKEDLTAFGLAGQGHMGFAIAAKKAIPSVYSAIKTVLVAAGELTVEEAEGNSDLFQLAKNKGLSFKILPVGHSLGAAIAKHVAVYIAQDMSLVCEHVDDDELGALAAVSYDNINESDDSPFKVVTVSVGGPRVTDKVAAREQEKALGGAHNIIQFLDYGDPVVFQPMQVLGYWHAGTIIPVTELTPYYYPRDDINYIDKLLTDVTSFASSIYSYITALVTSGLVAYSGWDTSAMMAFGQSVFNIAKDTALVLHSNQRYIAKINDSEIYDHFYHYGLRYDAEAVKESEWARWWFGAIDHTDGCEAHKQSLDKSPATDNPLLAVSVTPDLANTEAPVLKKPKQQGILKRMAKFVKKTSQALNHKLGEVF